MKVLRSSSSVKRRCIPSGLPGPQTKQVFVGRLRSLVSWTWGLPGIERLYREKVGKNFGPLRSLRTDRRDRGEKLGDLIGAFFLCPDSCIHIGFSFRPDTGLDPRQVV